MKQLSFSFILLIISSCAALKIEEDRKHFPETRKVTNYTYYFYIPFFRNIVEPTDMSQVCQQDEWKEIKTANDLFGGVLQLLTLGIIHPEEAVAICRN